MRKFVISVKDINGEWTTLTVLEIQILQPVAIRSDENGMITIKT
jgi:hypothetical protein